MRPIRMLPDRPMTKAGELLPGRSGERRLRMLCSLLFVSVLSLALLPVLSPASTVAAQSETPQPALQISDDRVNAIAKEMYCPVCENTPLDVCPTQACAEWRELIREMLAEGSTEAEIKDYFVSRFGDRVLAEPPRRGINWLIYILPPAAMLIGVGLLFGAYRSYRRPAVVSQKPNVGPIDETGDINGSAEDEYVRRIEEELRKQ